MLLHLSKRKSSEKMPIKTVRVVTLLIVSQAWLSTAFTSPVMAQPSAGRGNVGFGSRSADSRDPIKKSIQRVNLMDLVETPINLEVTDATVGEVASQINKVLPAKATIEVRVVSPTIVSLELKNIPAIRILQAAVTLSGGILYVLSDRLLIAHPDQLSDVEKREAEQWSHSRVAAGAGWDARTQGLKILRHTFSAAFQQQATAPRSKAPMETSLGKLSPGLQEIVQLFVAWNYKSRGRVVPPLSADTMVSFDASNPNWHSLSVKSQAQEIDITSSYRPQ